MMLSRIAVITCFHLIKCIQSFKRFSHVQGLSTLLERKPIHPNDVEIPMDKISFSFSRSSGPGGQNVNKVNSKAELRWRVDSGDWLASDIRQRIRAEHGAKISKEGDLVITSQEHRVQNRNKVECVNKMKAIIAECWLEPKEREMYAGIGEKTKQVRKEEKRKRSVVKENRRQRSFDDD